MTKLSASLKEKCLNVTLMMQNSPCCKIFIEPVDPTSEPDMIDYFTVIQDPQDIQTILTRINDDYYQTYEQWENAMILVFDNAIKFYGGASRQIEFDMANAMKKKFMKLCRYFVIPFKSQGDWFNSIESLYQKINETMKKYPSTLKSEFEGKSFSYYAEQNNEVKRLHSALSKLTDQSTQYELMQLLTIFGVKIDSKKKENTFKLFQLPQECIQALILFTKDKYNSLGMEYPK